VADGENTSGTSGTKGAMGGSERMPDKLTQQIDGALDLLDRQLLDADGRMLGKVDDVELTQTDEGLAISALLTGPVALLHRLGGSLGNELATKYVQLRPSETNRSRPWRVPMSEIERVDSAVHLRVGREGSVIRDIETFRLGALTGMAVFDPDDRGVGQVLDARFGPTKGGQLVLQGLVIGHGQPGSLLGYDRRPGMGPWLIRRCVGWLHRHTRLVDVEHVQILWNKEEVRLRSALAVVAREARQTRPG
jgi:sporulation protein YlmC with PRC-barrel domain